MHTLVWHTPAMYYDFVGTSVWVHSFTQCSYTCTMDLQHSLCKSASLFALCMKLYQCILDVPVLCKIQHSTNRSACMQMSELLYPHMCMKLFSVCDTIHVASSERPSLINEGWIVDGSQHAGPLS